MRYAQIKNGYVVNIVVCDSEEILPLISQGFDALIQVGDGVEDAKIGFKYENDTFLIDLTKQAQNEAKRELKEQERAEFEAFKAWKASQPK